MHLNPKGMNDTSTWYIQKCELYTKMSHTTKKTAKLYATTHKTLSLSRPTVSPLYRYGKHEASTKKLWPNKKTKIILNASKEMLIKNNNFISQQSGRHNVLYKRSNKVTGWCNLCFHSFYFLILWWTDNSGYGYVCTGKPFSITISW